MNPRISLAFVSLLIASLACGRSNDGIVVSTQPASGAAAPTSARIYKVGEVIQFSDHTVTMTDARLSSEVLQTFFTVTNTGSKDVNLSSLINFDARLPDGTKLERDIFNCTGANLDGRILPGESLKGSICWQGVSGNVVKVYYVANFFNSGATVWEIRR